METVLGPPTGRERPDGSGRDDRQFPDRRNPCAIDFPYASNGIRNVYGGLIRLWGWKWVEAAPNSYYQCASKQYLVAR